LIRPFHKIFFLQQPSGKDWGYLDTKARFRCVAKSTNQPLKRSEVALGHKPGRGAAEHWNGKISGENPGHTQTKEKNKSWNLITDNFHGPEETIHSSRSGNDMERHIIPGPHLKPPSYPMWRNPNHPKYVNISQ
jgi:hypothetical protein